MAVSLNGGTPHFTPQVLMIFSTKTHGFVGETHHFRKPRYITPQHQQGAYFFSRWKGCTCRQLWWLGWTSPIGWEAPWLLQPSQVIHMEQKMSYQRSPPIKSTHQRKQKLEVQLFHQPSTGSKIDHDFAGCCGIWELSPVAFHKTRGTWWTPPNCKTSHKLWPRRTIRFPLAESDVQFPPSASQFFKDIYNKCLFFLEEPIFPKNPCGQYFTRINII